MLLVSSNAFTLTIDKHIFMSLGVFLRTELSQGGGSNSCAVASVYRPQSSKITVKVNKSDNVDFQRAGNRCLYVSLTKLFITEPNNGNSL